MQFIDGNRRKHMSKVEPRTRPLVCDYMTPSPHTVGVDQSVAKARQLMIDIEARHLPVLDDGHLVGMVSERDLRLVPDSEQATVPVEQVMSNDVYAVDGSLYLADVALHMANHHLGSAVVTSHQRVIGILTSTDLSKALADVLRSD